MAKILKSNNDILQTEKILCFAPKPLPEIKAKSFFTVIKTMVVFVAVLALIKWAV